MGEPPDLIPRFMRGLLGASDSLVGDWPEHASRALAVASQYWAGEAVPTDLLDDLRTRVWIEHDAAAQRYGKKDPRTLRVRLLLIALYPTTDRDELIDLVGVVQAQIDGSGVDEAALASAAELASGSA